MSDSVIIGDLNDLIRNLVNDVTSSAQRHQFHYIIPGFAIVSSDGTPASKSLPFCLTRISRAEYLRASDVAKVPRIFIVKQILFDRPQIFPFIMGFYHK